MKKQHRDQSDIRIHNTLLLLEVLQKLRPVSRAEIAKVSRMSPASITRIMADLHDLELIRETSHAKGGMGRRAVMLDIVPEGLYTIGIHIDKRRLHLCLLDFATNVVDLTSWQYDCMGRSAEEIAHSCLEAFHKIALEHRINIGRVIGIGIGMVGIVDQDTGDVLLSPQLGWHDKAIKPCFERVFSTKVVIDNNVKASLIGEKKLMGIPEAEDTAMLLLGSGVGCAATSRGHVVRGLQNAAGELGHIIVDRKDGMPCDCGRRGCLQTHIASGHLITRAQKHDPGVGSLKDLRMAYESQKAWAVDIVEDCKDHISMALEIIGDMYNPAQTIVTGSFLLEFRDIMTDVTDRYNESVLVPRIAGNKVALSDSGNKSCVLGSAYMARNEFLPSYLSLMLLNQKSAGN